MAFPAPRAASVTPTSHRTSDRPRGTVDASLELIGGLDGQIDQINKDLRCSGADHPYVPLLLTVPGISWVLAFTIAAEIGDISRFASAKKLEGVRSSVCEAGATVVMSVGDSVSEMDLEGGERACPGAG